jgi:hypothetical protein
MTERGSSGTPWRGRLTGLIVLAVLTGGVAWYVGVDGWHASVIAAAVLAVGLIWMALPERPPSIWPFESQAKDDGNRNDVNRLSWSLRTRKRRVRPEAVRRIRKLAAQRLEAVRQEAVGQGDARPLDLDDPADRVSIERLIGSRAYRTLRSNPVRQPTFADVEQCLDALSALVEPVSTTTRKRTP